MDSARLVRLLPWAMVLLTGVGVFFLIGIEYEFLDIPLWLVAVVLLPVVLTGLGFGIYVVVSGFQGIVDEVVEERIEEAVKRRVREALKEHQDVTVD